MGDLGIDPFVEIQQRLARPHHLGRGVLQADAILSDDVGFRLFELDGGDAAGAEILEDGGNGAEE